MKLLPAVCAVAFCASFISVRADDTPVQAAARAALEQKMNELDAPVVVTPSGAVEVQSSQPKTNAVPAATTPQPGAVPAAAPAPNTVATPPPAESAPTTPTPTEAQPAATATTPEATPAAVEPVATEPPSPPAATMPAETAPATPPPAETMPAAPIPEVKPAPVMIEPGPPIITPAPVVVPQSPAMPAVSRVKPGVTSATNQINAIFPGKELGLKPIEAPLVPISATQQAQLQALLTQYKANQISPEEYHKRRAEILAQP